jgi:hypothetical protein
MSCLKSSEPTVYCEELNIVKNFNTGFFLAYFFFKFIFGLVRVKATSLNPLDLKMSQGYGAQILNTLRYKR